MAGFSTLLVTMMPFWVEKTGVPRTLAVEFPFAQSLGQPNDKEQQMRVIQHALQVLATATEPGAIVHSEEKWPIPQKEAYKQWQPSEPSPIIGVMAPRLREIRRQKELKD